jgi:hypothetical protein
MEIPFHPGDEQAVMAALGPIVPAILREGVAEGFHRFKASRALDPIGFADYSLCAKSNMLYDRIARATRELVDLAQAEIPDLQWTMGRNKRATDFTFDPYFAFRIKRIKANRKGLTTSVDTWRQLSIKSGVVLPVSQNMLDFGQTWSFPIENRVWITIPYDLDDLEEKVEQAGIGVETRTKFIWKRPLPEAEADIIASFPAAVADRVYDMRTKRSA